jgi:hypothetical protein
MLPAGKDSGEATTPPRRTGLEVMDETQVVGFPFRAVFGGGFEVSVEKEMAVAGEVPEQTGADGEDLLPPGNIATVHLAGTDLLQVLAIEAEAQVPGDLSIHNSGLAVSGMDRDLHYDSHRG